MAARLVRMPPDTIVAASPDVPTTCPLLFSASAVKPVGRKSTVYSGSARTPGVPAASRAAPRTTANLRRLMKFPYWLVTLPILDEASRRFLRSLSIVSNSALNAAMT